MVIQGKIRWAKILGEPGWGYQNAHKEWSCDVYIDDKTADKLVSEGLKGNIKDKGKGKYLTFKRREIKTGGPDIGKKNDPIRVVDHTGATMQDKDTVYKGPKIGNDSTVNVNFAINEYKPGVFNTNILSLQVWKLIPYEGTGEFPTRETTPEDKVVDDSWASEVED